MKLSAEDIAYLKSRGFVEKKYGGQDGVFLVQSIPIKGEYEQFLVTEITPDGEIQRTKVGEDEFGKIDEYCYLDGPVSPFSSLGLKLLSNAYEAFRHPEILTQDGEF